MQSQETTKMEIWRAFKKTHLKVQFPSSVQSIDFEKETTISHLILTNRAYNLCLQKQTISKSNLIFQPLEFAHLASDSVSATSKKILRWEIAKVLNRRGKNGKNQVKISLSLKFLTKEITRMQIRVNKKFYHLFWTLNLNFRPFLGESIPNLKDFCFKDLKNWLA